ncbi:hypothetical protein ACTXT7_005081 [Hymenolepis weldensis]
MLPASTFLSHFLRAPALSLSLLLVAILVMASLSTFWSNQLLTFYSTIVVTSYSNSYELVTAVAVVSCYLNSNTLIDGTSTTLYEKDRDIYENSAADPTRVTFCYGDASILDIIHIHRSGKRRRLRFRFEFHVFSQLEFIQGEPKEIEWNSTTKQGNGMLVMYNTLDEITSQ